MMQTKRPLLPRKGVPAALLGTLVLAVVAIATFIAVHIYSGLDSAARVERALVAAQEQLDDVMLVHLEEEAGLRGYVASQASFFLEDEPEGHRRFAAALDALDDTTSELGIAQMHASIAEMRRLHDTWERNVFAPLRAHPRGSDALMNQTLGKVLTDRLRVDVARVHGLLESQLIAVQAELRRRIDQALFGGLASVVLFGLIGSLFLTARARMLAVLRRERAIVDTLQTAFLTDLDALPGSRTGTAYSSADQDAAVGGDLFDVRRLDATRGLVVVADVSGKGIEAAVDTAFVKYTIRALAHANADPAAILSDFNTIFLNTIKDPNLFVVAFVGVLDGERGRLTYASAGHAGAWRRRGTRVDGLEVTGPLIGLDPSFGYENRTLSLDGGDLILLATDGLTEARTKRGVFLGPDGAAELFARAPADPQACADALIAEVRKMGGGVLRDDLAIVAIALDGPPAQAAPHAPEREPELLEPRA